jgi:hypothetical protein
MLAEGVVSESPLINPFPVGANHVNKVLAGIAPSVTLVGVTAKTVPLQTILEMGFIIATGLT